MTVTQMIKRSPELSVHVAYGMPSRPWACSVDVATLRARINLSGIPAWSPPV